MVKRKIDTGDKQAKAGKNGNVPPVEHRFKKNDPRINRNGRPRDFDQLRALVKEIAAEKLQGTDLTRVEAMILSMASSRNPRDRELFLQYGFGKVPDELNVRHLSDDEIVRRTQEIVSALGGLLSGDSAARLEPSNTIELSTAETVDVSREQSSDSSVSESTTSE